MNERRDKSLGDAVRRIPVPPRDEDFVPDLLARLKDVDAEVAARPAARAASGSRRLRRLVARRRGSLIAAAAVAAAVALILTLAGVPGMRETQPPPATALDRLVAAIDAGLAKVDTLQGVMVFDPPFATGTYSRPEKALFAATSAGDRLVDVHDRPDWARALSYYRTQLAALRKQKASYSAAAYSRALSDLKGSLLVPTRTVFVDSRANRHTYEYVVFSGDALTRRLARVKYINLGWYVGLHGTPGRTDAARVWTLATELRSMLADHADITVTDTIYDGRSAAKVLVPADNGNRAWEAIIDKQYGVTLAVRVLKEASGGGSSTDIVAFHVEHLQINHSLAPSTFAIKPDYRLASIGHARVAGAPVVQVLNTAEGMPVVHSFSPAELRRVASGTELVPGTVPAGYRLAELGRTGADRRTPLVLLYRRGMNEFVVWSGPRNPNYVFSGSVAQRASRIGAFDRNTWPDPTNGTSRFVRIHGGVLDGAPAAVFAGVGGPASLYAWTDTREASIDGALSRAELLAIAGSLRPVKGGTWGRTSASLASLAGVIAALVAAGVTVAGWIVTRRRRRPAERPQIGVLAWPLIGLVLVIAGTGLNWHALLHNGSGYASRGWSEPLGRWVVASAVLAVVCAAWRQLATHRRGPIGPKFLATLLATAALAGAAFALVYLPLEARFTVPTLNGDSPTGESWLMRIISSQFSPSATTGLYISILGALLLLVGVVMMRRPEPIAIGEASGDTAGSADGGTSD